METSLTAAFDVLRELGTPAEIRALADCGYGPVAPPLVNTHIHLPPNFSAFDNVEQAVKVAADEQIGVLGVSNYYDYSVYGKFVDLTCEAGIFPLFGLEVISMQLELRDAGVRVNDPVNPGKTYLCGKGITRFDEMSPQARRLIDVIRHNDRQRMATMIDRMRSTLQTRGLDTHVDEQAVLDMVVERHGSPRETVYLQERHIAQAFQEAFFERVPANSRLGRLNELLGAATKRTNSDDHVGVQNELRSHLIKAGKPAFVEESYLSFVEAHQLVLELGGIPSYPVLADGALPICEFENDPEKLINQIKERGILAVEWIPHRNKRSVVEDYVMKMRTAGLAVTAGTEHNTLDLIPFDPNCSDGEVPPRIREVFWEGACVVAAHQFLSLHGECGYVDGNGKPNADYASADARIKSMAKIGAAVIQRYFDTCATKEPRTIRT